MNRRYRTRNYRVPSAVVIMCIVMLLMYRLYSPVAETRCRMKRVDQLLNRSLLNQSMGPDLDTSRTSTSVEDVLRSRLHRVQAVCQRLGETDGQAREIMGNKRLKFAFCVVPKAGCTMWLRVLQYFAGQGRREDGPMSLSKHDVHYRAGAFGKLYPVCDSSARFIETSLRSMTVRDPYTRLWSAYIDKLLLPDFWTTTGQMIIETVRQNASEKSLRCGHDVTFSEFLDYVIGNGHGTAHVDQDKHWLPSSDICDPCIFQPEVIAKQETFMDDFKYTVSRLNITGILNWVLKTDPVEFEIEDEIDYNFQIYSKHEHCTDIKEICRRIWKAFQYNGYIPPTERFESYVTTYNISENKFLSIIRAVRTTFKVTKYDKKAWRKAAIKQAFAAISDAQKNSLVELYKLDFEMFGYDKRPDYF